MRIGIYAGTFDPVHNGHIEFARKAIEVADLDTVIMVAEKMPYRKKPVASWDHRQAMLERATEDIGQVDHDYQFANELAHQHTMADMLHVAAKHYTDNPEIWFLVGSDVYEHMHQWQGIVDARQYGGFVVALRDDHTHDWLKSQHDKLVQKGINPHYELVQSDKTRISSSRIREAIGDDNSVDTLPKNVLDYAVAHKLYARTTQ
ncbi:nicotinate-nicotinamide nucleotide adenylyltransferase [Candidatus Saccharibacteria bacterium]|nr:nicotinate-nicotinamide nucleotide adenylyltransferase [Candidatus Saccharibacteria bacterium]